MPYSTFKDVHVDRPLSDISVAHMQEQDVYVAGTFGTAIPVNKQSDDYVVYPTGFWTRLKDTARAEEGVANSINYGTKTEKYAVGDDALRIFISDKKRENADSQYNLDQEGIELVTGALLLRRERDFVDQFLTPSAAWGIKVTGETASDYSANQVLHWDNANATIITDWKFFRRQFIKRAAGRGPNKVLMTLDVYDAATESPDLQDRIKTTGANEPLNVTRQALAALMEVEEIVVMQTVYNDAPDGVEDANGNPPTNHQFMAEGIMLACRIEPRAGLMTATAMGTFFWQAYQGQGNGPSSRRYDAVEGKKGEYLETEMSIDQKIIAPDLGMLFTSLLSTNA